MSVALRVGRLSIALLLLRSAAVAQPVAPAAPGIPPAQAAQPSSPPAPQPAVPGSAMLGDARLAEVRDQISAAAHAAAESGLPAEWLLDKVAEGLAKGVPPGQILAAVGRLGERMRSAHRIQGSLPPARDAAHARSTLHALVDALSVGASEAAVQHLAVAISRSDPEAVHAGIVAVADLGERGFRGDAVLAAIAVAFERGGREGVSSLVQSADSIGGSASGSRLQALGTAASRITRPAPLAGKGQTRGPTNVSRPGAAPRDRAPSAPGRVTHPGPPR